MPTEIIYARRDSPEIILPTAASNTMVPGMSWAAGAAATLCTAAQFGTKPLILIGVIPVPQFLAALTTNQAGIHFTRRGQLEILVTPTGRSQYSLGKVPISIQAFASLSGIVLDSINATLGSYGSQRLPMGRVLLPASTLIQGKASYADATLAGSVVGLRAACMFYDPAVYQRVPIPMSAGARWYGQGALVNPITRCWPDLNSTTLALNTWTQIDAALDADYLIEGVAHGIGLTGTQYICELGLGAANAERIQARFYSARGGTSITKGGFDYFEEPFIAYRGERLSGRSVLTEAPDAVVFGRRLG